MGPAVDGQFGANADQAAQGFSHHGVGFERVGNLNRFPPHPFDLRKVQASTGDHCDDLFQTGCGDAGGDEPLQKGKNNGVLYPEDKNTFFSDKTSSESIQFQKNENDEYYMLIDFQGVQWKGIKVK